MDGLGVLVSSKRREPQLPVIIFSGHGNIDTAVSAISRGAVDFIEKPFEAERLLLLVARATETERLRREIEGMRSIDHPGMVKVLEGPDIRPIDGAARVWYVEPHYSGGRLLARMGAPCPARARPAAAHL